MSDKPKPTAQPDFIPAEGPDFIPAQGTSQGPTQFEQQRMGANTPGQHGFLRNLATGVGETLGGILTSPASAIDAITHPGSGVAMASDIAMNDMSRAQRGRSPLYRGMAGVGDMSGVVNAPAMEDAAEAGNTQGVLGRAVGNTAGAVAPSAMARGPNPREMLRNRIYQELPKGGPKLTPMAHAVGVGGGTAIGAEAGGWPGAIVGRLLGPDILKMVAGTPERGSLRNPGKFSMIEDRPNWSYPKMADVRTSPFSPGGSESVARPSRTMVLTPGEAAAEENMQGLATRRAKERGMQFAGGMVPREGRSVPRTPTPMSSPEYPGPREVIKFKK